LGFAEGFVDEKRKESFAKSKTTRRWHAMLEHIDELPFGHHRFIVTALDELLLELKACTLVNGVVEFTKPVPYLTSCKEYLKSFGHTRIVSTCFGKG
jgi:hypothetical protein